MINWTFIYWFDFIPGSTLGNLYVLLDLSLMIWLQSKLIRKEYVYSFKLLKCQYSNIYTAVLLYARSNTTSVIKQILKTDTTPWAPLIKMRQKFHHTSLSSTIFFTRHATNHLRKHYVLFFNDYLSIRSHVVSQRTSKVSAGGLGSVGFNSSCEELHSWYFMKMCRIYFQKGWLFFIFDQMLFQNLLRPCHC